MDSHLFKPENLLIFGIAGHARSGKDTAAKSILDLIGRLETENKFVEKSNIEPKIIRYAEPIRAAITEIMVYFIKPEIKIHPNYSGVCYTFEIDSIKRKLDEYKNKGKKIYGVDIRRTFQQIGDLFRNQNEDIFALITAKRIKEEVEIHESLGDTQYIKKFYQETFKYIYIIPDTRFVNEEKIMREKFGNCYRLIKIDRPEITEKAKAGEPPYDHKSEKQIELLTPDITITNDSTLKALNENVTKYVLEVMKESGWLK